MRFSRLAEGGTAMGGSSHGRQSARVALLAAAAVTAAAAIGLVGGQVSDRPRTVPVSEDVSVRDFAPASHDTAQPESIDLLAAGGWDGGAAVSYLKFRVDLPAKTPPVHAELWLARHSGRLPGVVELSVVPWSDWQAASVTAGSAPRLGRVVGSVFPTGFETAVHFDVTSVIRTSGEYAFAVTAPTSDAIGLFDAQESRVKRPPTLALQWNDGPRPSASPLKRLPGRLIVAPPSTALRYLQLPGWLPEEAAPYWLPTTDDGAYATASATDEPSPPPPPSPTPGAPSDSAAPATSPSDSPSGSPSDSPSESPSESPSDAPSPSDSATSSPSPSGAPSASASMTGSPSASASQSASASASASASPSMSQSPSASQSASPSPSGTTPSEPDCRLGDLAVPSCGVLWGVAPGAHTSVNRATALRNFESLTQRPQAVYHAYHRGDQIFPTGEEISLARDPQNPRILMVNWKPMNATWREIANGDPWADDYLDRLAAHLKATFTEPFFFTMHHEPEDDVRTNSLLGMTARDFAAAFRYVVQRLRAEGVTNLISVVCYMAYVPWNTKSWFPDLYPGDDVVDWVAWDAYAYSDPGYGYGDFAEMMNRRSSLHPDWPGFYTWAARKFPTKPLMVAEWGLWYSSFNQQHPADFFRSVGRQIDLFPRVKALLYFETPSNQTGRDSRVHATADGLAAYRDLGKLPVFRVEPPVEYSNRPSPTFVRPPGG
ncbi:MAG: hypothetical protein HOU81_20880 [Hamadaea sp.]|uniref:glycoside hydrolase family 26 protein n=1 Tax=Hamadaea sp. TaxID=2024425 RepID=UPI001834AA67|nr:hypothetical protein [Hamadaea sp.]NUR73279.1 hypothetical protein [Hamadaea sp.]NUT23482.1 hypothetical protein [Hamadaea sp.]